jgi:hypothetical protein
LLEALQQSSFKGYYIAGKTAEVPAAEVSGFESGFLDLAERHTSFLVETTRDFEVMNKTGIDCV